MIIAVASQKGGSGKSTLVTGLAALWAPTKAVLVVDADSPQYTAAWWASLRAPDRPKAAVEESHQADLHRRRWGNSRDIVLIDCPGRLDATARSALLAADLLLVPVQPSYPDAWALAGLADQLRHAQSSRSQPLPAFVTLCRIKTGTALARRADDYARELPPGFQMLRSRIRDLIDFQVAMGRGLGPTEHAPRGGAAQDLQALAEELWSVAHGQ